MYLLSYVHLSGFCLLHNFSVPDVGFVCVCQKCERVINRSIFQHKIIFESVCHFIHIDFGFIRQSLSCNREQNSVKLRQTKRIGFFKLLFLAVDDDMIKVHFR